MVDTTKSAPNHTVGLLSEPELRFTNGQHKVPSLSKAILKAKQYEAYKCACATIETRTSRT